MTERVAIYTYWGSRQESAVACARRLMPMLQELAALQSAFDQWVEPVESENSPLVPAWRMPPELNDMAAAIQKAQAMREMPYEPWPELGYMVHAWNGQPMPRNASLHLYVGSFGMKRDLPNEITIKLPSPEPGNEDLTGFSTVSRALLTTARRWDVLWGKAMRKGYHAPGNRVEGRFSWPTGGWMTYLSPPLAAEFMVPPTIMAERFADGALLLIATEEIFDPANPAHVAAADAIDAALVPIRRTS